MDALITGNLGPKSTPDFSDINFDPGEAQCSTKNIEKDLNMLSEVLKIVEIQHDKFGAGHQKEIKMYTKSIEDLEDEFDSTREAFAEDYQEFIDNKENIKRHLRWM